MNTLETLIDKLLKEYNSLSFNEYEQLVIEQLYEQIPRYSWVGFYWIKEGKLHLGAWKGKEATEHVIIPIGEGICGLAARTGETVIVDDVNERSEYLACFPSTKSEIVVPLIEGKNVIGELDIDGDEIKAFGEDDRKALEKLAAFIVRKYSQDA